MSLELIVITGMFVIMVFMGYSSFDSWMKWYTLNNLHRHLIDRAHYFRTIVNRQSVELNRVRRCAKCQSCNNKTCGDRNERA